MHAKKPVKRIRIKPNAKPGLKRFQDITPEEKRKILRRIRLFGQRSGKSRARITGLQQHSLAVNKFSIALATALIKKGAQVDLKKVSRASLWHDALRHRTMTNIDFITGKTKPSTLLGSKERTEQDYFAHVHEKAAKELLKRGSVEEKEAAKLLSAKSWLTYNNKRARRNLSLEDIIIDLGDAVVEGTKFVPIDKRLNSLTLRMTAYSKTEKDQYRAAFNRLRMVAKEKIEKEYGISINKLVTKLAKDAGKK